MRKGLIIVAALVASAVSSLMFAPGVAARNPIERTEGIAGAALGSPPSRVGVEVRLEEPLPAQAEGSFPFAAVNPSAEDNDDRVTIALATFGVAAAAVVVGLLGYLLRVWLGLVKPPPPPEEPPGSH
jgi:hypothetical protein